MNTEDILYDFFIDQLKIWELADKNYKLLANIKQKKIIDYPYPVYVIYNPERKLSTLAGVSKIEIENRKCFLCKDNRPKEQFSITELDFDILVNPYPVLSPHFTIAYKNHIPQDVILNDFFKIVNKYQNYIFFFNGSKSGASAPDHLHLQAVRNNSLPLINFVNEKDLLGESDYLNSKDLNNDFPFQFFLGKVNIKDIDSHNSINRNILNELFRNFEIMDNGLQNTYLWKNSSKENIINYLVVPRRKHRPDIYYNPGDSKLLISPGSIEMAGIIVTVNEIDYERTDAETIFSIYKEVGVV